MVSNSENLPLWVDEQIPEQSLKDAGTHPILWALYKLTSVGRSLQTLVIILQLKYFKKLRTQNCLWLCIFPVDLCNPTINEFLASNI